MDSAAAAAGGGGLPLPPAASAAQGPETEDLEDQVFRLTQENRDLREYADRATRELRRYQAARPVPAAKPEDDLPLPPWASNMQMMSPLLYAYEERISELEAVIERSVSLAEQAQALTRENDSLRAELKERTEQLRHAQLLAPAAETDASQDELQELYRLSVEQNEALAQQNQLLKVQLERMQQSLNTGQQQARELHARAVESTTALQARASESMTALQAEQQKAESLASQRGAAEMRLEEILAELVEEVRLRESLQVEVERLKRDLQANVQRESSSRQTLQERCKLATEEEGRLQLELSRVSSSERDLRKHSVAMERELAQNRGELDGTKQEVVEMMKLMESLERRLRNCSEQHEQVCSQLADQEQQTASLQLEKDRLAATADGSRRQVERLQSRLDNEAEVVRKDLEREQANLRAGHSKVVLDLEERLKRSEQTASELQGKVELHAKQRTWETSALERQASTHAAERQRLRQDLEEEHQERLRLDRQVDATGREAAALKRDLEAVQEKAREQAAKTASDLVTTRTRCQAAERQMAQAKEEMQVLEQRASAAGALQARLGSELREAREGSAELMENEKRRSQGEKQRLERQLQAVTVRAQREEQKAVELLQAQEALRQRWQRELGIERDDLEGQVERLAAENKSLREKSRGVLRMLATRRPTSPSVADLDDRLAGSVGLA